MYDRMEKILELVVALAAFAVLIYTITIACLVLL